MIVAQISDLHIRRRGHVVHHMPNTADYLRRTIDRLHKMNPRPSVVLTTGDLVERGSPHEYRRLRTILNRLEIPYFLIPGNHDDREALRKAFRDHRYLSTFRNHASYAFDAWPLRIVALDSTDPRHVGGYLDEERLHWLDGELSAHSLRPTIIALHHPPFRTGVPAMDVHGFVNSEALGLVVRRHSHVARIVSGHVHTVLVRAWNGTLCCTAPSTSPQFVIGRSRLGVGIEAPGMLLHEWNFNAEVRTSIARLEDGVDHKIA
ncbi:MAG: phosphodiesterase [Candidatus Eremiobacteraeota bacterium]|nr:phosphodiesterase [Candidatus Eremiobacteraeota bacterium]